MVCLLSEVSVSRKIPQTYLFLQIILQKKLYTNLAWADALVKIAKMQLNRYKMFNFIQMQHKKSIKNNN